MLHLVLQIKSHVWDNSIIRCELMTSVLDVNFPFGNSVFSTIIKKLHLRKLSSQPLQYRLSTLKTLITFPHNLHTNSY